MLRVLLVDDEHPALNYLEAIIQKYLPDFQVVGKAESAESALQFLERNHADVLITDITMPGEMNGIDLAREARAMDPNLRIVIVSGYSQFEYARSAVSVGVEDYLLKPISVSKFKETLEHISSLMTVQQFEMREKVFAALAAQKNVPAETVDRAFGPFSYCFAILRIGNLTRSRFSSTLNSTFCLLEHCDCPAFYGHDENELILLMPEELLTARFSVMLTDIANQISGDRCWTAVYDPQAKPMRMLPAFLSRAFPLLYSSAVIGRTQCLPVTAPAPASYGTLSPALRKQLSVHITNGSWKTVQELFLSLAVDLEENKVPQDQVERICQLLLHFVVSEIGSPSAVPLEDMVNETYTLCYQAASVGELLSSLYETLFGNLSTHDRKISGKELCDYTLEYIRDHYTLPLNIQSVCAKIGFSQTYLSRLLRKYADTTVNTYLTQCRINAAKDLLQHNPAMLLRDVASAVGYDDQSYFNKIFRSETGLTPKQYAAQFESDGAL